MDEILPVKQETYQSDDTTISENQSSSSSPLINDQQNDKQEEIQIQQKTKDFPIEIGFLFYFIAYSLASATFTNQLVFQTCHVILGYNITDCSKLGSMNEQNATDEIKELETKVQPYTADIQMIKSIIESIIPAILSFFIGPWSDKYGRKPVILVSVFGCFLLYATIGVISIISNYINVNPWFYLLGSVFVAFSGGACALITGMFAYLADVTRENNRDYRMGLMESAIYLGIFFGSISSSYVLKWTNPSIVFGIASLFVLITYFYVLFGVRESLQINNELQPRSKLRELFRIDLVLDLFVTCFKRRQHYDRAIIWLIISALVGNIFVLDGTIPIYFLFFREKLGWTIKDYSFFESASILIQFFGSVVGSYFILKVISGGSLAILGNLSYVLDSLILAFGRTTSQMYAAISITFLRAAASPMTRALLSKSVESNEVGKVFSMTTSLESLTPIMAAPLYTLFYNQTLDKYPGAFNLISVGVYGYCVLAIIIAILLRRRYTGARYESINES